MLSLLVALAAAAATAAARPAGSTAQDSNPGCTAGSFGAFDWTLSGFEYNASYIFSTPAHQISTGVVHFNLSNPALTYQASCTGYSTQLQDFFYGDMVYNCTVPPEHAATTAATFTFDYPGHRVAVNQTWVCSDQDPEYPDTFLYAGAANLTLTCIESNYQNPNWTMGQIYSSFQRRCNMPPITITPYLATAEA